MPPAQKTGWMGGTRQNFLLSISYFWIFFFLKNGCVSAWAFRVMRDGGSPSQIPRLRVILLPARSPLRTNIYHSLLASATWLGSSGRGFLAHERYKRKVVQFSPLDVRSKFVCAKTGETISQADILRRNGESNRISPCPWWQYPALI